LTGDLQIELQRLGLLPAEAQIYLALLGNGKLGATALARAVGMSRTTVYPTLKSLLEKGLIEAAAGYGTQFSAIPPAHALPVLIGRVKETLVHHEQLANSLMERLSSLAGPNIVAGNEFVHVTCSPGAIAQRFERLQLEAREQVEVFVKAPLYLIPHKPVEGKVLHCRLRFRCLYEPAAVSSAATKASLADSMREARVHGGELPHRLAIFDRQNVLLHFMMPNDQARALVIRHRELATSLGMLFDCLWERAKPLPSHAVQNPAPSAGT
jgi:sugar-specific transcriptional regulator TrmB